MFGGKSKTLYKSFINEMDNLTYQQVWPFIHSFIHLFIHFYQLSWKALDQLTEGFCIEPNVYEGRRYLAD